jgi:hypothetical protein
MNAPNIITSEEWNDIETWLDHNGAQGQAPLLNEKLTQIPNFARKIECVKKTREEIEDSIRQSRIKAFHHDIPVSPVSPDGPDSPDSYLNVSVVEKVSGIKNIANKKIKPYTFWYAGAAVLAALLGIFWMMKISSTSEKIFATYFKPDIGLPLIMGTTNAYDFYEGMLDYKQENYMMAIEKWQILLEAKPENDTLNYFLGVANLAMGNAAKSSEFLENQERFRQGIFKEDASWYAALAKIKEGKLDEARVFLQKYPSKRNTALLNELYEY